MKKLSGVTLVIVIFSFICVGNANAMGRRVSKEQGMKDEGRKTALTTKQEIKEQTWQEKEQAINNSARQQGSSVLSVGTSMNSAGSSIAIVSLVEKAESAATPEEKTAAIEQIKKTPPQNKQEAKEMLNLMDEKSGEDKKEVREAIKESLSQVKDENYASVFREKIKKGDLVTRELAVKKAQEFKDKEAVPDLIEVVKKFEGREGSSIKSMDDYYESILQIEAVEALGDIGDDRAIDVLISKLGKDGNNVDIPKAVARFGRKAFLKLKEETNNFSEQKKGFGSAIYWMSDKSILPELWKLAQENGKWIPVLLKNTDNTTSPTRDEVVKFLENNIDKYPDFAADLLNVAKEKHDISYLIKIAQSKNEYNGLAIIYLGDLKVKEAIPVLEELFKSGQRNVYGRAATALEKITGNKYDRRTRTVIEKNGGAK